ncbi:hypothetical protein JM658_15175 [Joostella atrarenae]|uniref:Uncharacterized protein n=1 Tax=Joostella atrarenae TaxID=679257 RepID=A0ABS9J6V8_9FLAO|nr:hypothetical protein [Joostella atrarenae]MCF8716171.1 hypothetical protein [Joostella atrarenae]
MNQNYLTLLILFFTFSLVAHPGKDSLLVPDIDTTVTSKVSQQLNYLQKMAKYNAGVLEETPKKEARSKVFKSFPDLDNALIKNKSFYKSFKDMSPEFDTAYLEENFPKNPKVDTLINQAINAFEKVKELNNFVDIITGNELLELPVGLGGKIDSTSGNGVELAISEVKFHPEYAEFNAWAKLTIPQKEKELYFGAQGVKLSHDGALIDGMRLVLLGDVPIPINGDNWLLTLKGGVNLDTGAYGEQSFVEFDCSGLKAISLEGDLRVSRKILLPIDSQGNYVCGNDTNNNDLADNCYVGTSFSIKANGWNDLLMEVSLPDFEMTGFKGWGFHVERAVLDLSDFRNVENLTFPKDYNDVFSSSDENLWRGFYAEEVSVMLPKGIKRREKGQERVTFGAKNLVIDSYGVSGYFYGKEILPLEEGAADKWGFGIDSVSVNIAMNGLRGGSLKGAIQVPTFEEPMGYHGWIAPEEYGLAVTLAEDKTFKAPVFSGTIDLKENSNVGIKVLEDKVYPFANLTGSLSIETDFEVRGVKALNSKKDLSVHNITFEQLELNTEPGKPIIDAKSFGYDRDINFNVLGFPVVINNLHFVKPGSKVGLAFDVNINLDDNGLAATSTLRVLGKLEEGESIHKWKFDSVDFGIPKLDTDQSGYGFKAELNVFRNDPTYGDGFEADVRVGFKKLELVVEGKAMFGSTDFRYWFVDVWSDNKKENGGGKLLIKSFTGGLSYRMRREINGKDSFTPSKAKYFPEADYGLGLRAGVEIGLPNPGTFSGKAFLEMQFNTNGGLNKIGFIGEGTFMSKEKGDFASTKGESASFPLLDKVNTFYEDNKQLVDGLSKSGNFLGLGKKAIPLSDVAQNGRVGVYVGIEKDFTTNTFHGEFEVYIDLEGIRGAGTSNRAGYAVIHDGPDEWYLHLGTPVNRLGILFSVPPEEFEIGGYFMTGDNLPDQVAPHPRILQILGDDILNDNRRDNELTAGRGFAFGLNFVYRKNFNSGIFYAFIEAGAGFDVMHAYYANAKCKGRSGPVGNNGWYSMGQVYAYLYGEFGVEVNLLFINGKFPIIQAGIAALLRGQFPNPVFVEGYVGMYYSILGGLVKGRYRIKVEFGEECIMENMSEAVGVPIISDVKPADNEGKVSVFTAPQAVFNYTVNENFTVQTDEGERTFRIKLKEFKVTSEGKELEGRLEYNSTNDAVSFIPVLTLPSKKRVNVKVEVSFDEYKNGNFSTLTDNGKLVTEKRELSFITDKAPDHIPFENITYMYPIKDQKNFYGQEYNKGYVKMGFFQDYLFNGDYTIKGEFTSSNGTVRRTDIKVDQSKSTVFFDIPEIMVNTDYEFNLMAFPPGQDVETEIVVEESEVVLSDESGDTSWFNKDTGDVQNMDANASATVSNKKAAANKLITGKPKSLLEFGFHTSEYETFGKKVKSLNITGNVTNYIYANVHSMSIVVNNYEPFEEAEIKGVKLTNGEALISAKADLKDSYYKRKVYPLIYENYPLDGTIRVDREEEILGVPPARSFYLSNNYMASYLTNPNSYWVKNRIPFVYNLPYQYNEDFVYLRDKIVNKYSNGNDVNQAMFEKYKYIMNGTFPPLPFDKFGAQLIYRTPGGIHEKGYDIDYRND